MPGRLPGPRHPSGAFSLTVENLRHNQSCGRNPADQEVTDVLGKEATVPEQEAYRLGHQSGWFKGALAFGCAALAGLAVFNVAFSGGSKPAPKALLRNNG